MKIYKLLLMGVVLIMFMMTGSFSDEVKPWSSYLKVDEIPLNTFDAYFVDMNNPSIIVEKNKPQNIYLEHMALPESIEKENLGVYFVGDFDFKKNEIRTIRLEQNNSFTKVIIDGESIILESDKNEEIEYSFTRGRHRIEVEHTNNGEFVELLVDFGPMFGEFIDPSLMASDDVEKITLGLSTDSAGLNDWGINDNSWYGLERLNAYGYGEIVVKEAETADDYWDNLVVFSEAEFDLIYGIGFLFNESMTEAAENYPEQKFAIVDSVLDKENVASIIFSEHEAAFLAGVVAGLATETDTIAFIGGMKFPLIEKYEYGFKAGVGVVNPKVTFLTVYADTFADIEKTREIAELCHSKGADVIYHCTFEAGQGIIEASENMNFWSIGCDIDQSHLAPDNVLCSMVKHYDEAVYQIGKSVAEGTFIGGVHEFSLSNNGVGISDNAGNLSEEQLQMVDVFTQGIKSGNIIVPQTENEFEHFMATW